VVYLLTFWQNTICCSTYYWTYWITEAVPRPV